MKTEGELFEAWVETLHPSTMRAGMISSTLARMAWMARAQQPPPPPSERLKELCDNLQVINVEWDSLTPGALLARVRNAREQAVALMAFAAAPPSDALRAARELIELATARPYQDRYLPTYGGDKESDYAELKWSVGAATGSGEEPTNGHDMCRINLNSLGRIVGHFVRKQRSSDATIIAALLASPSAVTGLHPDTQKLVQDFTAALAEKLHKAEQKYGYGAEWKRDDWTEAECQHALARHVAKGDPRDVAAYCAFMWYHGWSSAPSAGSAGQADGSGDAIYAQKMLDKLDMNGILSPPGESGLDDWLRKLAQSRVREQPVDQQARRHANTLLNCLAGFDANPHPGSKADLARQWLRALAHPEIPT